MIMEKPCAKCTAVKPLTEFYRNDTYRSRRARVCKTCYSIKLGKPIRTKSDIERIKAIMSVPIKPEATHFHYMSKGPIQKEQEIGV